MVREHSPQTQPDKTQSDQIQSEKVQTYAPLQSGDRLSRPEFERRYAAAPHIKKAELIEGIVYVASPPAILIMKNQLELGGTSNSSPSIMKVSK
jgi:hypothetical protein